MSRVNLGLYQSDVSVIWDLGPHDFSILLYWLDERPSRVISTGRACIDGGKEDVAFITCEFDSGTIAHIELSWLAPSKLRRTTVVGSKKMVVYDDCSNEPVRVYDARCRCRAIPSRSASTSSIGQATSCLLTSRAASRSRFKWTTSVAPFAPATTPSSSAQLGLDVVRMIEAADRSRMHISEPGFLEWSAGVADR